MASHPTRKVERVRSVAQRRLYRLGFSGERVEDAVQEALCRSVAGALSYKAWDSWFADEKAEESFIRFVCVIARNVLRDQRRREAHFDALSPTENHPSGSADAGTEEVIILTISVHVAFTRLPEAEAEMLLLYGRSLTCEDIAKRYRQSREWAKKRIQRARKRLRLELEAEGYAFSKGSDSASEPS